MAITMGTPGIGKIGGGRRIRQFEQLVLLFSLENTHSRWRS